MWTDANGNGVSQAGEVRSLTQLGITRLDANATATSEKNAGNWIGLRSTYQTADGATHESADVWFLAERTTQLAAAITAFAEEDGASSEAGGGLGDAGTAGATTALAAPQSAAPLEVSRLVDAMRAYQAGSVLGSVSSALAGPANPLQAGTPTSATSGLLAAPETKPK